MVGIIDSALPPCPDPVIKSVGTHGVRGVNGQSCPEKYEGQSETILYFATLCPRYAGGSLCTLFQTIKSPECLQTQSPDHLLEE